jgi:hypothetical protein
MALPKSIAWRRLDLDDGLGAARVSAVADGFAADGCDVVVDGERLWWVTWGVDLHGDWRTRSFAAAAGGPEGERDLTLVADRSGSWKREGEPAPELEGCTDVDIVSTPFTNTLPIRRLGLGVGESADIRAAWVDVPSLELAVSSQRYTRLEPKEGVDRYRFVALDSGVAYILTVDDDGIVIDYEWFAQRVVPLRG